MMTQQPDLFGGATIVPSMKVRNKKVTWQCPRCARYLTNRHLKREYVLADTTVRVCTQCYRWLVRRAKEYGDAGWKP